MSKKIHLTKLENDQIEVGVQLRDSLPAVPKNNRIAYYKSTGELKCRLDDTDYALSLDIRTNDPVTPAEKQVWINETDNNMKWHFGGTTKSIQLDDKMRVNPSVTDSQMLATLNEVELKTLSGNETSPKSIIDAFIEELFGVVLTNTEIHNSTLRVVNGETVGTYEIERRTSGASNYVDGLAVLTSQGVAPHTVVDELDGTHTMTFKGDITKVLSITSKVLMFEEEVNLGVAKGYHLLNGVKPAVLGFTLISYDIVTDITTVVVNDLDLDLTLGFSGDDIYKKVRLFPLNLEISAGANGLTGTMTNLEIQEAYTMDKIIRVVGKTVAKEIVDSYRDSGGRGIVDFAVAHSPNKQNWIIPMMISRGSYSSCVQVMYSTDGLQTINKFDYQGEVTFPSTAGSLYLIDTLGNAELFMADCLTHIHDDGRFLFHREHQHGVWAYTYEFGNINPVGESPWIRRANAWFGGYRGIIHHEANTSYHYYCAGPSSMDWENNLMAFPTSQHSVDNAYTFFARIDWDNKIDYGKGYIYVGADYHFSEHTNGINFFKHFEGEYMYFGVTEHLNNYLYAHKAQVSNILAKTDDCGSSSIAILHAFSASTHGGNRSDYLTFLHADGADDANIIDYAWDEDDDRLVFIKADTQNFRLSLGILDFGRTTAGAFSNHKLEFNGIPDNGNFTYDVTNELTGITETISPIPYSADIVQVKAAFEGLSFVTLATVTGDFATGFDITLEHLIPVTMVANSNSLVDVGANAITITHTMIEEGYEPVWLRLQDIDASVQPFTPENGGILQLNTGNLMFARDYYIGDDSNIRDMARAYGHRLIVKGKTVIFTGTFMDTSYEYDTHTVRLFKIPNYEEFYGYNTQRNSVGTLVGIPINNTVEKMAHKITIADPTWVGIYPDNKVPFRTLRLYMASNWNTTSYRKVIKFADKEVMVRVKLLGVDGLGNPDESNVLAVSKYNMPASEVHAYDDYKWETFVFDNVKFDVGQEVFIMLDTNLTQQEITDSNFYLNVGCDSEAGGAMFKKIDGNWESIAYNMWYEIFDYYMMKLHLSHDTGWNNSAWTSNGYNNWGYKTCNDSITEVSENQYKLAYLSTQHQINNISYAHIQGKGNSYVCTMDDSLGADRLPVIGDPKLVGQVAKDVDDKLALMYYPCIDSGRYGDERVLERNDRTSDLWMDTNYKRQRQPQVGGFNVNEESYSNRLKITPTGYTDHTNGQVVDDRFATGMATHHNNYKVNFNGNTNYSVNPNERDFIFEVEIAASATDLDNGDNHIFSTYYAFICSLQYNHYRFISYNNGQSGNTYSYEECPLDTYHRLRVVRDENGLRIYRNFSKAGGTWEQLQLGYNNSDDGSWWANGTIVGRTDSHTLVALGGYTYNTTQSWYGLTGYLKMAVGTTEFKYEGCNNTQMPVFNVKQYGDIILANKQVHGYGQKFTRTILDTIIVKDDVSSSLVPTNDQVIKFGETVAPGQKASLKLTVKKESDSDPSSVQGISTKFDIK